MLLKLSILYQTEGEVRVRFRNICTHRVPLLRGLQLHSCLSSFVNMSFKLVFEIIVPLIEVKFIALRLVLQRMTPSQQSSPLLREAQ